MTKQILKRGYVYPRSKEALMEEYVTDSHDPSVNDYLVLEVLIDIRDELHGLKHQISAKNIAEGIRA